MGDCQIRDDAEILLGNSKIIRLPHRFREKNSIDVVEATVWPFDPTGWFSLALEAPRDIGRLAMRTYNLFRRADRDELICAVPEDRPVPSFIIGPPWEFVERGDESVIGSLNFNREAAEASVQWNGFYLFQLIHASDFHQRIRQGIVAKTVGDGSSEGEGSRQKAPERPSEIRLSSVEVELEFEVASAPDSRVSFLRTLLDNVDLRSVRK